MMHRLIPTALLAVAPLTAHANATDICLEVFSGTTAAQCGCATAQLVARVSGPDKALYDAVGDLALAAKADGQPWADAWEAGLASVAGDNGMSTADLRARLNPVGSAHGAAIKDCE